jgi:hypothetical protein
VNWGRATLGTIPFVYVGSHFGPEGVLIGQAAGSVVFGVVALVLAFWVTNRLHERAVARSQVPIIAVPGGRSTASPLDLDDA